MQTETRINSWLDCDPGLDDTLALLMASHHQRINLVGVSTSAGNTSLDNTTRNALDLLYNAKRQDVPVIQGSNELIKGSMDLATHMHGANGLGGVQIPRSPKKAIVQNNFKQIFDIISKQDGKVTWMNTGSLTNLCRFLRAHPEVTQHLKQIVIMGGSSGRGNRTPAAEFNIYFDPHAFEEVLKTKKDVPLVMIPLDTTSDVLANEDVFTFLESKKQVPLANAVLVMMRSYQQMYKKAYKDILYPILHDPCVPFYLVHPELFKTQKCLIVVDTCPVSYGRTNVHFNDPKNPQEPLKTIDLITLKLNDISAFWKEMIRIMDKIFAEQK